MTVADPWLAAGREFEAEAFVSRPDLWVAGRLGEHLWSKQREIAQSVVDNRYTAVPSCHGAGKSYVGSRLSGHWIDTKPRGDAFLVTTAPSSAQVTSVLWREIAKAHAKGKLPGRITTAGFPKWKIGSEEVGYGRKPADYQQSVFQGIHAPEGVLIVVDEAGGVERSLWDSVDTLATNLDCRVLAIGNPDDPASHFAEICKPGSGWHVIRIDGLRTPLMSRETIESTYCPDCGGPPRLLVELMELEGIPYSTEPVPRALQKGLVNPLWVEERLHRWVGAPTASESIAVKAAKSPLFTAKVRGLFPDSATEGVIPLGWIERAIDRWRDYAEVPGHELPGRRIVSADPARFGKDETVIGVRQGPALSPPGQAIQRFTGIDTMEAVAKIEPKLQHPQAFAVVDVNGLGAGVVDRLRQLGHPVVAFNSSANSGRTDRLGEFTFKNDRDAAYWRMRELLDPAFGSTVMLPDDDTLRGDLAAHQYKTLTGAKIKVEPKENIEKRLGRSPDVGDMCVMAFFVDGAPVDTSPGGGAVPWGGHAPDGAVAWDLDEEFA